MDSSLPRPALEPPKEEEEEAGAAIEAARAAFVPPTSIFSVRKAHARSKIQKLI